MADRIARKRWTYCFKHHRMSDDRILNYVIDGLRRGRTPERISGRVRLDYPTDPSLWVRPETISTWIDGERHDLNAHKRRRHKHGPKARKPTIPHRISIDQRPREVNERRVFGHPESDTVIGRAPSKTCLGTQVERKTRFLMCKKISDKSAPLDRPCRD